MKHLKRALQKPSQSPFETGSWSRADLHLHTTYSDGLMSPQATVDLVASRTALYVIAVTDHDTAEGAWIAQEYARRRKLDLEVVIGQEVTTGEGDVLALFIQHTLPRFATASEAIAAIHRQGGLAVAAHPFGVGKGMTCVKRAILDLPFDAVEARHGCPLNLVSNWYTHFLNQRGQRLPEVGSSDSHVLYTAGEAFTWFPGRTAEDLRCALLAHRVRPGGPLWTLRSLLRVLPVILRHGWPEHVYKPELAPFER